MMIRRAAARSLILSLSLLAALSACGQHSGPVADQGPIVLGSSAVHQRAGGTTVVAAGDIQCPPGEKVTPTTCQSARTASLITAIGPTNVIALGDLQYGSGKLADFQSEFTKTWGQFDSIMKTTPGNHEYVTPHAAGYSEYFSDPAPEYYAWQVAGWRIYLLDSECDQIDCAAEARWLAADLTAHPTKCSAIAMHFPRFSSGPHHSQLSVKPLWDVAYAHQVDLALAGHDHDYERFAPLDPAGQDDPMGVREFVVGTGGKSFYGKHGTVPGSQYFQSTHFGVLQLSLAKEGFDWSFIDTDGRSLDSGSTPCH
jgi:acid phosphatase type 7